MTGQTRVNADASPMRTLVHVNVCASVCVCVCVCVCACALFECTRTHARAPDTSYIRNADPRADPMRVHQTHSKRRALRLLKAGITPGKPEKHRAFSTVAAQAKPGKHRAPTW